MPATDTALLLTALAMGLLGSTHCVGMCGGISAALSFALPPEKRQGVALFGYQLAYNLGRIGTYALLGVAVGALAHGVLGGWATSPWPRVVAGLFMVVLGLYLAGWWMGLRHLEGLGGGLWNRLGPLRQAVLPVNRPWKALVAGGVWGFLPCGLVYSALALALARADALVSGGVMLAFGLGTLPMLLLTGTLAGRARALLQRAGARRLAGLLVIVFGVWTAAEPLVMRHLMQGGHLHGGHGAHGGLQGQPSHSPHPSGPPQAPHMQEPASASPPHHEHPSQQAPGAAPPQPGAPANGEADDHSHHHH